MALMSETPIEKLTLVKSTAPDPPAAGQVRLYIDVADEGRKLIDENGNIVPLDAKGWLPFAYPLGYVIDGTLASPTALAANGGSAAMPVLLPAPMLLQSVSVRNFDTATQRTWGWDLYCQLFNSGNASQNTLARVAACTSSETFTPSAASTRTLAAGSAPVFLVPGLYWLVIQNRHASNAFSLDGISPNAFAPNLVQTKTTTNPNGATLDFVAATWTKGTGARACCLNGRVFGQTGEF